MTDSKSTTIQALMDALEPAIYNTPIDIDRAAYSQAISLKRIADALEILARPAPSATSMSHDTVALQILPGTWVNRVETADDWREWPGGECPVAVGTRVDVKFRDSRHSTINTPGHGWDWHNNGRPSDIVAWRSAK